MLLTDCYQSITENWYNEESWHILYECLRSYIAHYQRNHSMYPRAILFESDESLIDTAFAWLWQSRRYRPFDTIAGMLAYTKRVAITTLHNTVHYGERYKELSSEKRDEPIDTNALLRDIEEYADIRRYLTLESGVRRRRVGYLIYYCGMKPRDIVRWLPHEFKEQQEVVHHRRMLLMHIRKGIHQVVS